MAALAAVSTWTASLGALALAHYSTGSAQARLDNRAAAVASAEIKIHKYRADLHQLTDNLARRQAFIEQMVQAHLGDLPQDTAAPADGAKVQPTAALMPTNEVGAPLAEANALRKLEAEQLAFADRLTRYADERAKGTTATIRKLGLNPKVLMASAHSDGMGGPFSKLSTERDGTLDLRLRRMGESLSRLSALEESLAALPQVSPAHVAYVSSSYGYRSDPFTGGAAFHAGLDFPGPMGSPIYAAAKGKVTFIGQRQGYGNCIEVTHGNGLMTRYGHLSGFRTHTGALVEAGAVIGAMGSTGRSTGPHLHFEVRINDRPVNPRPFLEAASKAQKELRS